MSTVRAVTCPLVMMVGPRTGGGVGDLSTEDPQVMMDRSRDGGHTFTDERWREMGKIGEYYRRAIWRRNGKVDRTDMYRFKIADKVKVVGIQLTGDVHSG